MEYDCASYDGGNEYRGSAAERRDPQRQNLESKKQEIGSGRRQHDWLVDIFDSVDDLYPQGKAGE